MKIKDKFTIEQKLHISSGALLGIVLLLIISFIYLFISLSSLTSDGIRQNSESNKLMNFSHSIKDFISENIQYEVLKNVSREMIAENISDEVENSINKIMDDLELIDTEKLKLKSIHNEIMSLTDLSIEQSNNYIKKMSDQLADAVGRKQVSTIERLVIHGANVNTSVNYTIKVLFLNLQKDMSQKDELLSYLEKAIVNASNDVERLKNTPFAQLPVMAVEANKKMKNLSNDYVNTKEKVLKLETNIFNESDDIIISVNESILNNIREGFIAIKITLFIVFLILIAVAIGLTYFTFQLSDILTAFLKHLEAEFSLLAKGDLTGKTDSRFLKRTDEIGKLSKSSKITIDKIRDIVIKIMEGSKKVNYASKKMSSIAFQMSNGATEQAASTEEVSSSMEQMSASIKQNAENSAATERIALSAEKSMQIIRDSANNMAVAMNDIINKISIINEIAGKTDLLAINAAVEAARAGEQGKGFAIVAGEVRQLAEHSRKAAAEIDTVSQSSVALARKSSELIAEVIPDIQNTAALVKEITAVSQEQNSGIEQVNNAIQQLASVTEQHATSSEEVTRSASDLAKEAQKLKDIISFFKTEKGHNNYLSVDELNRQIEMLNRIKKQQIQEQELYNDEKEQAGITLKEEKYNSENIKGLIINLEQEDDEYENY